MRPGRINLLTPNDLYNGRTAPLTSKVLFYIFIHQINVVNILNTVYTHRFFSSKRSLFLNSNVFGSCIIHILYIYSTNIGTKYFSNTVYTLRFLLFKMQVHNSNLFGPCIIHIIYIYSTNIGTEYFKHGIYSPFFFPSKCSLFHNSNVFGSRIIHFLYSGCAKI